jgi:DNA repair protein RadC
MKNEYTNQTKQHTVEELARTADKRVDIVKIQMVKDKSLMYKYRSICCPNDGYQLMRQFLGDADREHLVVICLNTKN